MKTNKFSFGCVFLFAVYLAVLSDTVFAQHLISGKEIKTGIWNNQEVQYVDGEIAVKIKQGFTKEQFKPFLSKHRAKVKQDFDESGLGWIELPQGTNIMQVIDSLKKLPMIEAVAPNQVAHTHFVPNDLFFRGHYQWGLHNIGQSPPGGTNDADIDAPEAWDTSTGSSNVVLAILDTGIPLVEGTNILSHPDLDDTNKIIIGRDFIETLPSDTTVRDRNGHGTHVAGIAAAETNNRIGVAGVAWNCKLMVIQVFDANGEGDAQAFYNGVIFAVNYYKDDPSTRVVINYSGGGPASQAALDAVIYANTYGVTIVASTGNENKGIDYPAAYSSSYDNVIAVGATNHNDLRSSYSNYGSQLNVVAPGGNGGTYDADDIFSTTPNYAFTLEEYGVAREYGYMWGTSMAAPHVTGVVGLMLTVNPSLTPSQIRNILQKTTDKVPSMNGADFTNKYGYGRLNAYKAVASTIVTTDVNYRWNMLSVPVVAWDFSKSAVFPTSSLQAQVSTWKDGDYITVDITDNRLGYWVRYPSDQDINYFILLWLQQRLYYNRCYQSG